MWWIVVAMLCVVIAGLMFFAARLWDRCSPLPRHPLYESVLDQVRELEARKGARH